MQQTHVISGDTCG